MSISVTYHEPRYPNVHQEIKLYKTTVPATPPISSISAKAISVIYPEPRNFDDMVHDIQLRLLFDEMELMEGVT